MNELSSAIRQSVIDTANAAADAARAVTLAHFRTKGLGAENKLSGGFDPVTLADRAAERAMVDVIARMRPDDAILGEEYGARPGTSGLTWVLDPIDGTRSYISGAPTWGVLIGLRDAQNALLGVIDQPYIGERFIGGLGHARLIGPHGTVDLATRRTAALAEATLFTTYPQVGSDAESAAFHALAAQCKLTRYGLDCYAYALLAAGHVDLVVEAGLQSYDIMAPIAVIEAAGGIVTDWAGGPAHEGGRIIAAANADLHAQALATLSRA
ncbi:MAG: histidinol-phosphatase [Paracoccaceae bacterium]